jgi:peptide/nickel transport system permease protein
VARYLFRRTLVGAVTVFFITSVVFFALRLLPGDPVAVWLGEYSTPELVELTQAKWGLDQPLGVQYLAYVRNLASGDLGDSLRMRVPVSELLLANYPYTLRLMLLGTLISVVIAIPLGILAAVKQNTFVDMFVMMFSFLFISVPSFWLGLLMLFVFSFNLRWFPAIGGETGSGVLTYLSYLVLPCVCMGIRDAGLLSRMVRSTMVDTMSRDYITVARSKGLSERVILYKHALRNALSPIVSLIGVSMVLSLAGAVVLEVVFSRPGLGRLYVNAVAARDYPLIQGGILLIATAVVVVNLIVDISYAVIDPRIRYE